VYKAQYLSTKSGTDAFSCSTDGQVLFWDVRKLSEPIETLLIDPQNDGRLWGAVSMEYESTMPTKFQVGTEQGAVVLFNRKAKNPNEKIAATYQGHHGPVYAVERNPFFPKYFMSIGDWTMRIWCEDVKESAVIWSEYHKSYLLTGAWSHARPGVCFTGKHDGSVGIWDLLFKTNQPALTLQVADAPIGCIRPNADGQFLACGSNDGNVTLLSLNETLSHIQPNEKPRVSAVFERETSREKVLASRMREVHLLAKAAERQKSARPTSGKKEDAPPAEEEKDPIVEAEEMFWEAIANDKARREKEKAKKEGAKAKEAADAAAAAEEAAEVVATGDTAPAADDAAPVAEACDATPAEEAAKPE
jgi:dynein intermediate chain 2